jgi:hypothetical protein
MFKIVALRILLGIHLVMGVSIIQLPAQCPMCKASVEANLANGGKKGAGLNKGILFLLVMPYLAASVIGYRYYQQYRKRKKYLSQQNLS